MHLEYFKACFLLAGLEYTDVFNIENGYCGNNCCPDKPWFLFRTKYGLIKIGWRKRVIDIDWSDTTLRAKDILPEDDRWVTSWDCGVHAWGYGKCVEYLTVLRYRLEENINVAEST